MARLLRDPPQSFPDCGRPQAISKVSGQLEYFRKQTRRFAELATIDEDLRKVLQRQRHPAYVPELTPQDQRLVVQGSGTVGIVHPTGQGAEVIEREGDTARIPHLPFQRERLFEELYCPVVLVLERCDDAQVSHADGQPPRITGLLRS